jgi:hypothetical protein
VSIDEDGSSRNSDSLVTTTSNCEVGSIFQVRNQEHVMKLLSCPVCLFDLWDASDYEEVSHVACCSFEGAMSADRFLMGGFIAGSHLPSKWYTKILSIVTVTGHGLGKSSGMYDIFMPIDR